MSDWESHGGVGGITARYEDILSLARLYNHAGDTVGDVTASVARLSLNEDLHQSALISPTSYAKVLAILVQLGAGPSGLLATTVELEALSFHLRAGVTAYRAVDTALAHAASGVENGVGFALGTVTPLFAVPVAMMAVPAGLAVLYTEAQLSLPGFVWDVAHGDASLTSFPSRVLRTTKQDAIDLILAHPGAVQHIAGGAAGFENGLFGWLPGPVRWALPFHGVPRSYGEALGILGGAWPVGKPVVGPGGRLQPGDDKAPTDVRDLFNGVNRRQTRGEAAAVSGEIGVQRLVGADGITRYVVQLPGTETWPLKQGVNVRDLATNVHTMAGETSPYMAGIEKAMEQAHIPKDAPVMLVGHSQGGMTGAALAADEHFREKFNVTQVVTAGSPIAHTDIPAGVQVLAVENRSDIVPGLDGADNRDRVNVTTMTFDDNTGSIGENHSLRTYAPAMADVPRDNPSYAAWRKSADGFLDKNNDVTTTTYAITRKVDP